MSTSKLIVLPESDILNKVIGAAIKVHSFLGPGLLESSYETCLDFQLRNDGLHVNRQLHLPIEYYGVKLDAGYRIDLMVEEVVLIEIKSVDHIAPIHEAQLLTYLKLARKSVGLIMNFNVPQLKQGIRRLIRNKTHS